LNHHVDTAPTPAEAGLRLRERVPAWLRPDPIHGLGLLLLVTSFLRGYRLRTPARPEIFDETFYVNAARIISGLHVPKGLPYFASPHGVDPNIEHPPLGKVLLVGSMHLFGDNGFGWRLPSLLAGTACIVLVYAIVCALSDDGWLAVLAATIFAFDTMVFVHSRVAMLDMPMLAFMLLAAWLWVRGRPAAAGAACGLALLVKLPAIYGVAALVLLALYSLVIRLIQERSFDRRVAGALAQLLVSAAVIFFFGLWLLDLAFTKYHTPWAHIHDMLAYGFSLGTQHGSASNVSDPWRWLINETRIPYVSIGEKYTVDGRQVGSSTHILFQGAMNPVVIGAAPLAVSYVAWRAWRMRDALSVFVLAWIAATYLPYYPLVVFWHRTTYIYYILPTLPALAIAIAQLLRQARLPGVVVWGYLAALLVGFGLYFPFRGLI
jgi:dolichyl-phosphate-mannose-protein mannosyltransferase